MASSVVVFAPFALFVPLFAFISVAVWSDHRTRERAAFYRSEVLKKAVDANAPQALQVIELIRDEERNADRRRRDGLRLGGLVVTLIGIGLPVVFSVLEPLRSIWAVGFIPLLVGVALLLHSYVLVPRSARRDAAESRPLS